MTRISIIRLTTSEDLISFVEEEGKKVRLQNPMNFYTDHNTETGDKELAMSFWLPFNFTNDDTVTISADRILFYLEPRAEFVEYYLGVLDSVYSDPEKESKPIINKNDTELLLENFDSNKMKMH